MMSITKITVLTVVMMALCIGAEAHAQQMPGRVLFRVRPEAVGAFRSLFAPSVSTDPHFDPQRCNVHDASVLRSFFGLPASVSGLSLKPFSAEHNVVLETLREHTNPLIFNNDAAASYQSASSSLALLRSSEERLSRCFELRFDAKTPVGAMIVMLKKSGLIEVVEPRSKNSILFTPNDPDFPQQYSLTVMNVPKAWDIIRCDTTMLVAVDDIGTDYTHPDLQNAVWINSGETGLDATGLDKRSNGIDDDGDGYIDDWHGWDFAGADNQTPDNDPITSADHGTHTGGIMAASGNNGIGIAGVAFGARLMTLKCGDDGGNDVSFGYEGMIFAADHGAKVVNNSWGGTGFSQIEQDVINYTTSKNCVVVAAAGNYSSFENLYPGSYNHVLCVAATDESSNLASFSDFSTHVSVSAPGNNVLSTIPGPSYADLSGTSMASPNAAGVVALVRQRFPNLTPDQAEQRVRVTAMPLANDPHPGFTGRGIVQADAALDVSKPHFAARITNVAITDDDGDNILRSGEGGDIILTATNFLDPIKQLQAKIEVVSGGENIDLVDTQVLFGDAATLQQLQNVPGSFRVNVHSDAASDAQVLLRVSPFSLTSSYDPDPDYIVLNINPTYLDLNKNNVTLTMSPLADLGYNDPPNNTFGEGMTWTVAPQSILPEGKSVLFQAGVMIGKDATHVVAAAPDDYTDAVTDQDFTPTSPAHYVGEPDHGAAQEIECVFNDSKSDSLSIVKEVGVTVRSRGYEYVTSTANNAVVLDYLLMRRAADNGTAASNTTAFGLYMDLDIGASGANNTAAVSPLDSSVFVTRRLDPDYPLVGVKIISSIPNGASENFYALNNDGSNGTVGVYNGFPEADKWTTLTTPSPTAGPNDVSIVPGVMDLPLATQDSIEITYIIALGTNDADLLASINEAERLWNGLSAVRTTPSATLSLQCYPMPFFGRMTASWGIGGTYDIRLVDVLGREVYAEHVNGSSTSLDLSSLPAGAYQLRLESNGTLLAETSVLSSK